ncbi:MAG: methylated-DNA--[Synergistaceae bacterium]|nr:methylated-DNA--[protein]-cysteine S-methyltransferase [Synergistaceae bacterium]
MHEASISSYDSPLGKIMIACDDEGLTLLSFGQPCAEEGAGHPVINDAKRWLDVYFAGDVPDFTPPLHYEGTDFQRRVWKALLGVPYGRTTTYKAIADELGCRSAQAVGQAVGRNPISIIIPCHRVIGSDGSLTGYAGGLERKAALLRLEGVKISPLP